ncbi:AmpG family muropeptide MFS transporter [Haliangium sp.]|uniref:AmpG family muropeptide MFS transporter n=1 Tax=Haliangium sp. TaxID=2663208 RepID=UPI003D0B261A
MDTLNRWLASVRVYGQRRMLLLLALGFSSGLPFLLVYGTLSMWLKQEGLDIKTIGLFAAARMPYSLKFTWAPIIDRVPLPWLTRALGRRRAWMLVTQVCVAAAIVAIALSDPAGAPLTTAALALALAAFAASQDIFIDTYRIDLLDVDDQGAGAAATVLGYRVGMLAGSAGVLYLVGFGADWSTAYLVMAALMVVGLVATLLAREPAASPDQAPAEPARASPWQLVLQQLQTAVFAPFRDFMTRRGWYLFLSFVLLYRLGDALAAAMTNVFLLDIGFDELDIANVVKTYGLLATIIGVVLGGSLVRAIGVMRALWIAGFVQMSSNLMFSLQAWVGADLGLLVATIGVENIAGGVATAAFVAYLSGLCNKTYSATQYALLTALGGLVRNLMASTTGVLADLLGWLDFFLLTTAAAVPGLLVLYALQRLRISGLIERPGTEPPSG